MKSRKNTLWTNIALLTVALLLELSYVTGGIHISQIWYFVALAAMAVVSLLQQPVRMGDGKVWLLVASCVFSLLVNAPPPYFRAWQRLLAYIGVLFVASPMVVSKVPQLSVSMFWNGSSG